MPDNDHTEQLDALPMISAVIGEGGKVVSASRGWGAFHKGPGWHLSPRTEPANLLASCAELTGADPAMAQRLSGALRSILAGTQDHFEAEYQAGSGRWFRVFITGRGIGSDRDALAVWLDISSMRQALTRHEEGEALLRAILDSVPDALVVINEKGVVQSFSRTAEIQFGYGMAEVVGRNVSMLMPSPYREAHDSYLQRYLSTGQARVIGIGRVVVGRRKDGSTFPMELTIGEVHGDGERLFAGFARDLTEKQATEARMQELQSDYLHESRLHSLGEMAAQLAHELNQPLTATRNYLRAAQMLLDRGPGGDPARLRQALDQAATQVVRAGEIITHLREFVARGKTAMRPESIVKLVEEASALALVGARQRGVNTRIDLAPGLPLVQVDRVQVQQVLLNLMRNAIEAMDDCPAKQMVVRAEERDGGVLISVSDTGCGIGPEVAAKLFQPFVTTKSEGMGIGLSTCRAIAEAHGGRIWWEPNAGGGTVFHLSLNAAPPETPAA